MNQFKKAKQQAMKTGHYNESATDLNTAGVVQTSSESEKKDSNKNTESVNQSKTTKNQITEPDVKEKVSVVEEIIIENKESSPITSDIENNKTVIIPASAEPMHESIQSSDLSIIPPDTHSDENKPQDNASFEASNHVIQSKIEEQPVVSNYEPTYPANTYPSQEQVNVVPTSNQYMEQPVYVSQEHNIPLGNHNKQQPIYVTQESDIPIENEQVQHPVRLTPEPAEDQQVLQVPQNSVTSGENQQTQQTVYTSREQFNPNINQPIETATYISQDQGIPVNSNHIEQAAYVSQEPVIQANTQSYEKPSFISQEPVTHSYVHPNQSYHEPATRYNGAGSKSQTSKKNIPNIFSPKGEAKSMRKSLVLKPTSVKIAENYCAKNGGSFNELIQTLLDNFIDEYGL